MGTYDDLQPGELFMTPAMMMTPEELSSLIRIGGYTHPLFTDEEFAAASPFGRTPVPGEGLLLVMGGLVEQTGRFDDTTIGLVGFDDVRFVAPAFADDSVRVEVDTVSKETTSGGKRGIVAMKWRCTNEHGAVLVEATARMMFRLG